MANATTQNPEIILKDVRLSFPDLFHATEFKEGDGKPRWNATFLVVPGSENDKKINAAIAEAAKITWKDKADKMLASIKTNSNKFCYLDGNSKDYDGYEGMMYLASHRAAKLKSGAANSRPAIIDRDKSPLTEEDGKPYAGCYVNAKVSFYAQAGENPGMRCSFSVVQFSREGDKFGAGAPSTDEFESLADGADAGDLA